jgi:hypothetical protein
MSAMKGFFTRAMSVYLLQSTTLVSSVFGKAGRSWVWNGSEGVLGVIRVVLALDGRLHVFAVC